MMNPVIAQLLRDCLKQLSNYRDACHEDGMPFMVKRVQGVMKRVEKALITELPEYVDAVSIVNSDGSLRSMDDIEGDVLDAALGMFNSRVQVSAQLGIPRSTLYRRLREKKVPQVRYEQLVEQSKARLRSKVIYIESLNKPSMLVSMRKFAA